MPIQMSRPVEPVSYDVYHARDYNIMGIAFSIHRELERFWHEQIYQNELAYRCQKAGFENVAVEVVINVSFEDFLKVYYIDLLIDNVIYELKTAQGWNGDHEKQVINYLLLSGLNHAKLVNFRPPSVEHRFVSTKITPANRYNFELNDEQWRNIDESSIWLKHTLEGLINEWGVFLEVGLFYDAIIHFRGGKEKVAKKVEVRNGSRVLGKQKMHLIAPEIAFKITSVSKEERYYENHLQRFIQYTSLKAIQWINFNHHKIVFKTVLK